MVIELTLLDGEGNRYAAGTSLVLLGDGQPLATAELDAFGIAHFEADTASVHRLAVKFAA
jgi:hypothetical protein